MLSINLKNKALSIFLLTQALCINTALAEESAPWSYVGRTGPDHWSKLDKEFALCSEGVTQSPINLDKKLLVSNKDPITFHYEAYKASEELGKHIEIAGKTYKLVQFHFHLPSEHSIGNKISEAEIHFVHQDKDQNLAVVGVMLKEAKSNQLIKDIIAVANKSDKEKFILEDSDLMGLLPENKQYFHYMGSLTTPPCSENVHWHVLKMPLEASKEEIAELKNTLPTSLPRPIQDDNGRKVK